MRARLIALFVLAVAACDRSSSDRVAGSSAGTELDLVAGNGQARIERIEVYAEGDE